MIETHYQEKFIMGNGYQVKLFEVKLGNSKVITVLETGIFSVDKVIVRNSTCSSGNIYYSKYEKVIR